MVLAEALIDQAEADREIKGALVSEPTLASDLIVHGSEEIERVLDRKIVTRGTITEFHTFRCGNSRLWSREFPILATPAVAIYEDETRVYGASTLLAEGTDYLVDYESGCITRIDGSAEVSWLTGLEAVKLVYAGGYTQDAVPGDLKRIAAELFAMQWNEVRNNAGRIQTATDDLGTRTFFGPAMLTSGMLSRLDRHRRISFGGSTYSRSTVA